MKPDEIRGVLALLLQKYYKHVQANEYLSALACRGEITAWERKLKSGIEKGKS